MFTHTYTYTSYYWSFNRLREILQMLFKKTIWIYKMNLKNRMNRMKFCNY